MRAITLMLVAALWCGIASAQVPHKINYQGFLTDSGGTPISSSLSMVFKLYTAAGSELYSETQTVTVNNGIFDVVLGSAATLNLPFDVPYYLGVGVGTDPEMTPRQLVTASPYALRAANADALAPAATVDAAQVTGTVVAAQIADHAVTQLKLSPVSIAVAGQVLGTDGNNLQWQTASAGTVTSVGTGSGLTGGPITGSGTIDLATTQLLPAAACAANQIPKWIGGAWTCAADNDINNTANDARYFKQNGNAFGAPALLGTTDAKNLYLIVNGATALRLEPNGTSPNHISGYEGNSVTSGAVGANIGGGGKLGSNCGPLLNVPCQNRVSDDYGTVGGGVGNIAGNDSGPTTEAWGATVGGGSSNTASGPVAVIGGGEYNTASGSTATVGGGFHNTASGSYSTAGGGGTNYATGTGSTIGGGTYNSAYGDYSTANGGNSNYASGYGSAITGGQSNTATGNYANISGGYLNTAGYLSFAAGRRAKASQPGMFVWADTYDLDFDMTQWRGALNQSDNTFNVRATGVGGVFFATAVNPSTGQPTWACYTNNGSGWTCTSDRNVKRNLRPIDTQDFLAKVARLPVYRWQPRTGPNSELDHVGPMAQDFYAAFGLGDSDKSIGLLDAAGVALGAIQGLNAKVDQGETALRRKIQAKDAEVAALKTELAAQKKELGELRRAVELLMARAAPEEWLARAR